MSTENEIEDVKFPAKDVFSLTNTLLRIASDYPLTTQSCTRLSLNSFLFTEPHYRVSQKKTIHCLISCNVKSIKAISLK